jgi:hypothetical protein
MEAYEQVFDLLPDEEQKKVLARCFDTARQVYNHYIDTKHDMGIEEQVSAYALLAAKHAYERNLMKKLKDNSCWAVFREGVFVEDGRVCLQGVGLLPLKGVDVSIEGDITQCAVLMRKSGDYFCVLTIEPTVCN